MAYLLVIALSLALLGGFVLLTTYEAHRGVRVFAGMRARLDRDVEKTTFIFDHVDLAAFAREEIAHLAGRAGHAGAHLSLQGVRTVERSLTRVVRQLRSKGVVESAPRTSTREFVKTLSDFKGRLEATRPEVPEVL